MPSATRIRRALISVYDKTGIVEFARALRDEFGVEILSTGGTAKALTDAGIPVTLVESITGFGEMLDGRVKTLHPRIHAAILADRDNPEHMRQLAEAGIEPIDLVVVNLYPFEETVADPNCTFEQAIEMIDIGGVALLRAAAKNHRHVAVLSSVAGLAHALHSLRTDGGESLRREPGTWEAVHFDLGVSALAAFLKTSAYDDAIASWLSEQARQGPTPAFRTVYARKIEDLRYGENPHQAAEALNFVATNAPDADLTIADSAWADTQPPLSFNNYLDADAALGLCAELTRAGPRLAGPPTQSGAARTAMSHEPPSGPQADQAAGSEVWDRPRAGLPAARRTTSASRRAPIRDETDFRRHLPHIQRPGASYFITFRIAEGSLTPAERDIVMECCLHLDGKPFCLHAAVCMPDHVHVLVTPLESAPGQWRSLTEILHALKGNIGRRVAEHRGRPGPVLQDESFDHIVRNRQDLFETLEYIETNPVRARLGAEGEYPWLVIEAAPEWDPSTRAAGVDPQHELQAGRGAQRPWHSKLRPAVRETQRGESAPQHVPEAGGSGGKDRPLASPTPAGGLAVCCFIKHTNACGVGVATAADDSGEARRAAQLQAYERAYLGDPNAAMGGILACNFDVDAVFAAAVMQTYDQLGKPLKESGAAGAPGGFFVEVWIAPSFTEDAVAVVRGTYDARGAHEPLSEPPPRKKWGEQVRLLAVEGLSAAPASSALQYRSIAGGLLAQTPDLAGLNEEQWRVVTKRAPDERETADLRLAWLICKHTKSNAISLVRDGMLIGNGAGQMSRVMSCRVAVWMARENGHLPFVGDRSPPGLSPSSPGDRSPTGLSGERSWRRHLPHIERPESTYFVTFRVRTGKLAPQERDVVLSACRFWHGSKMTLHAACVMPDHVHLLLTPFEARAERWAPLAELLKSIKGFSSSQINRMRATSGPFWMDENFDRILRDAHDFAEKWDYMWHNPVTAGLVGRPEEYPWFWSSQIGFGELAEVEDRPEIRAQGKEKKDRSETGPPRSGAEDRSETGPPRSGAEDRSETGPPRSGAEDRSETGPPRSGAEDRSETGPPRSGAEDRSETRPPRSGAEDRSETGPPGRGGGGAVAASDAFFPFRDGPDLLIDAGVTAIIQPGGSKRDAEVIAACDERGVAMIFTGTRHFRH